MMIAKTHLPFPKAAPLLALAALALAPALAPTAAQADPLSVVMSGLNNPYGLAFGPDGGLYVADAGTGGAAGTGPSFVDGNGATVYFGDTGDVTELLNGVQSPFLSGLPSLGPKGGGETTGLADIAFSGGSLYGVFGLGADPAQLTTLLTQLPAGSDAAELGQVVNLSTGAAVSNVAAYDTPANYKANNPDYGPNNPGDHAIEANPYALAALPGGGGFAVTDGGGNVVLKAPAGGGAPSLIAALPALPNPLFHPASPPSVGGPTYQSVPTGIALGPNGSLYVGEFGGFPAPAGGSGVFRLDPATGAPTLLAGGFTAITGLTFGPGGDLYVLDDSTGTYYAPPGVPPTPAALFRVDPLTGAKTLLTDLAAGPTYTGLAAGPDDALYISSLGAGPAPALSALTPGTGNGQVLRYSLAVPEAPSGALFALALPGLALLARRRRAA